MNFALIIFIAILVTGLVCLVDMKWFKPLRSPDAKPNWLIRESYSFFPILCIVFVLRSFMVEPFRIPSSSLEPTLLIGDFLVVNKFIYGIRLPIIEKKILPISNPKRGDIVVFRWPPKPKFDYIKRVVGLPGDTVEYRNKQLFINGKPAALKEIKVGHEQTNPYVHEFIETLPDKIQHHIYQRENVEPYNFKITVPEHYYLMMGDNRDDSADSRFWGFVPDENLRGKAIMIWMSLDKEHFKIRFKRIGAIIH